DFERDLVAPAPAAHGPPELVGIGDRPPVDRGDDVVDLEAALGGRRGIHDLGDLAALGIAVETDTEHGRIVAAAGPESAPGLGLHHAVPVAPEGVDRDVNVGGDRLADPAVDANDLAVEIEQGAAG